MLRFPLAGKAVLITGASSGIGEALALECARRGARLALASRNLKKSSLVAARCLKEGAPEARAYALDVGKIPQVRAVCKKAERDFKGIDVLVNNAGIHAFASVEKIPEKMFASVLDTNLFGPLRLIQALLPGMKKRGRGMIVNIGSNLAFRSIPFGGAYSATKGALARLTESLRDEVSASGIFVLHAAPGVVTTGLRSHALYLGAKPQAQSSLPFPRSAEVTAKEIADAMEKAKRDIITAAFPVKIWAKWLVTHFPGMIDRQMRVKK